MTRPHINTNSAPPPLHSGAERAGGSPPLSSAQLTSCSRSQDIAQHTYAPDRVSRQLNDDESRGPWRHPMPERRGAPGYGIGVALRISVPFWIVVIALWWLL